MRFSIATSIVSLAVLAAAAPQPALQRTGMAIPISKRSSLVNADKSVNYDALKAHVASVKAKILRGLENFEKNTGTKHPSLVTSVDKRGNGDPLTDDNSILWYGQISVGTPAKNFTVDFDTGSSDLFLPGPNCPNCGNHTIYNPSASSTSKDLGRNFTLLYGDGSTVSGEQYSDTVSIVGYSASGQTLGAASNYSAGFQSPRFPADGLMGMAFPSISTYRARPVFQSLISQANVDPVFSFKLSSSGAELYLGGSNSTLYAGDFAYASVTYPGFWEVTMDSVQANGQTILCDVNSIIDTGTTLIIGNPMQVSQLYNTLGGQPVPGNPGIYTFSCKSFPSMSFSFGGQSFEISGSSLNLGPITNGAPDCVSGLVGLDVGGGVPVWIVGDAFLQNVYTQFDFGNLRVGFANLA